MNKRIDSKKYCYSPTNHHEKIGQSFAVKAHEVHQTKGKTVHGAGFDD